MKQLYIQTVKLEKDILIVTSPHEKPEQLCSALIKNGLSATPTPNVETAFEILKSHVTAFLLLDIGLDGAIPFLEKVMATFYVPPPYILTINAFNCSLEQADARNLGADACIEKPLDIEEALAVINAVLRRADRLARPMPLHTAPNIEQGT